VIKAERRLDWVDEIVNEEVPKGLRSDRLCADEEEELIGLVPIRRSANVLTRRTIDPAVTRIDNEYRAIQEEQDRSGCNEDRINKKTTSKKDRSGCNEDRVK